MHAKTNHVKKDIHLSFVLLRSKKALTKGANTSDEMKTTLPEAG